MIKPAHTTNANERIQYFWMQRRIGLSRDEWAEFYQLVFAQLMRSKLPAEYADQEARRDLINTFFAEKILLNAATTEAGPLESAFVLHAYLKHFAIDLLRQERKHISLDENTTDNTGESSDHDCDVCGEEGVGLTQSQRQILDEAGIDIDGAMVSADRFLTELDAAERIYLSRNTCADAEDEEPLSGIAQRLALGSSYHYKAKQLGITGAKGGFFSGYENTKLGKWLVSLGAQINRDWQQELLILIAILCLRSQAIAGPR